MDYASLIHEFIDGSLDKSAEQELFSELASNGGLRSEMKQFIEFEKAAKFDTEAYTPSSTAAAGVFNRLNIDPSAVFSGTSVGGLAGFFTGKLPALLSSVATAVATVAIMLMIQNYFGSNNKAAQSGDVVKSSTTVVDNDLKNDQNGNMSKSNIPVVTSKDNEINNSKTEPKVKIKYIEKLVPVFVERKTDKDNEQIPASDELTGPTKPNENRGKIVYEDKDYIFKVIEDSEIIPVKAVKQLAGNSGAVFNPVESNSYFPSDLKINSSWLNDFAVEISGNYYKSLQKPTVEKSSKPLFEDFSASVLYSLSEDLSLGLEYRQEFFFQQYDHYTKVDGAKWQYLYSQYTNYDALGLIFRYEPDYLKFSSFSPFIQGYAGVNQVGYIGRGMFGIEILTGNDFSFILGAEYTNLNYSHKDDYGSRNYTSDKLSFHYGMKYKF